MADRDTTIKRVKTLATALGEMGDALSQLPGISGDAFIELQHLGALGRMTERSQSLYSSRLMGLGDSHMDRANNYRYLPTRVLGVNTTMCKALEDANRAVGSFYYELGRMLEEVE